LTSRGTDAQAGSECVPVEELAVVREAAFDVHRRRRPVVDLLYSTGARLQEACNITMEDVTDTYIVCATPSAVLVDLRFTVRCHSGQLAERRCTTFGT
jgi:hypothetical protein